MTFHVRTYLPRRNFSIDSLLRVFRRGRDRMVWLYAEILFLFFVCEQVCVRTHYIFSDKPKSCRNVLTVVEAWKFFDHVGGNVLSGPC